MAFDARVEHASQQAARLVPQEFLIYLRMREWREHGQLHALCGSSTAGRRTRSRRPSSQIHKALLTGLLGNVGLKSEEEGHYLGARGIRFYIHPGSALRRRPAAGSSPPNWSRRRACYARCIAKIEPEWLEEVGAT
jgi:ATP-dependent helicase HrpA